MDRTEKYRLATLDRLPLELHLLIFQHMKSARAFRALISTSKAVFVNFLDYWPTMFAMHMDIHLLPEALTIVRLRQIHRQSKAPVGAQQLVDLVCESLNNVGPVSPRSLLPHDFTTVVALLKLVEETDIILTGTHLLRPAWDEGFAYNLPGAHTSMYMNQRGLYMYFCQRGVLAFELYMQALFRVQGFAERTYIGGSYDRLTSTIKGLPKIGDRTRTWTLTERMFDETVRFVCRQNDKYLRLASRKAVSVHDIPGRSCLTSDIKFREPARSLHEALDDSLVSRSSTGFRMGDGELGTLHALESLPNDRVCFDDENAATRVGVAAGDQPVYRIACRDERTPFHFYGREFLFKRNHNGLTAVAEILTVQQQEGWDPIDEINYLWQMVSGGISPLVQLSRMNEPDRLQFLADQYVRAPSADRSKIESRLQCRSSVNSPFLKSAVLEQHRQDRSYHLGLPLWPLRSELD
ncbi:hypothetical protein LX32DRAFT_1251 [Colletotrichum zoysiae]|uniref:Uncharacterized protein n=1 Tax=Colletotrichum zoysiae TaxID=1216348 RepID=A0AAD9M6R0_9PEZI|nr:hypothetical protein LX32DRAFT_1251 [Colletotrichum zoysiae]